MHLVAGWLNQVGHPGCCRYQLKQGHYAQAEWNREPSSLYRRRRLFSFSDKALPFGRTGKYWRSFLPNLVQAVVSLVILN
jgi:hypothetical protein